VSTRRTYWHDRELIFPMGLRKTANWERAIATGGPLEDTCPVHAWPVPQDFSEEWRDGVLILTFHPCGHRGYPQWSVGPSRWLDSPIAQQSQRRRRWRRA
jgi:hypothetical protein